MVRETSLFAAALALAFVVAACPPTRYAYAPVTTTNAELVGHPADEQPFPPGSPHGRVRLATFGIAQLERGGARMFHVRVSAENRGTEPWVLLRDEQRVVISLGDNAEHKTTVRAATDVEDSPARVEIAPAQAGSLDLFFPLPPEARDAAEIPAVEVIWTVREGERAVARSTKFERFLASGPALGVPRPEPVYPYGAGPPRRPPGTPDTRWPQPEPRPAPLDVPRDPLP